MVTAAVARLVRRHDVWQLLSSHGWAETMPASRAKINKTLVRTDWVKVKIKRTKGRQLRVLTYARYSTDEQNPRSIDAQVDFCKAFLLGLAVTDEEITIARDPAISGEIYSRPGINQVRDAILSGRCDLIIAEDASRLFRNEQFCFELVGQAVDRDIRVICINDLVDTADDEEIWETRLHEACQHHQSANRYTRRRIMRELRRLWEIGAAIGLLKPGYLRKASVPATAREPEQGPYFDEIDPQQAPLIVQAFERIAGNESPYLVAEWLTKQGLRKTANSSLSDWTEKNVKDLTRRLDYIGIQEHRRTISTKRRTTGKHVSKRNDEDEVWTREMPQLRIVSDDLRARAIAAIEARDRAKGCHGNAPNFQAGIPRDSRGPLSGIFFCRCKSKMQLDGKYRCGSAVKKNLCWNKASAERNLTHTKLSEAIFDNFPRIRDTIEQRLPGIAGRLQDDGSREERRAALAARVAEHQAIIDKLVNALERACTDDEDPPEALIKHMAKREIDLGKAKAELQLLDRQVKLPTMADVDQRMQEVREAIAGMDRGARDVLSQVITPIEAYPCSQFGSDKVVLRARFEIKIAGFLPPTVSWPLDGLTGISLDELFGVIPVVVDLFEPSAGPGWWAQALALAEQGVGLTEMGKRLGIGKRCAHLAKQYGEALRDAGLSDPFTELLEAPKAASRWRPRGARSAAAAKDTDAPAA